MKGAGIVKACAFCGTKFQGGNARFGFRRKYCSDTCIKGRWRRDNLKRHNAYNKEWRRSRPEYYGEYAKKNPDKIKAIQERSIDKYFGGQGLRKQALERDRYICQLCGSMTKQFNVHHRDENKKNNTLENLITLCVECHATEHYYLKGVGYSHIEKAYVR